MKHIVRSFVFAYVAMYVTQAIIGGFDFGGSRFVSFLVIVALALLFMFEKPALDMLSLPSKGIGMLVMNFILVLITLYILTVFIQSFNIVTTTLPGLRIFGFVLPSRDLTVMWSVVCSSLLISSLHSFLSWLCSGNGKKK